MLKNKVLKDIEIKVTRADRKLPFRTYAEEMAQRLVKRTRLGGGVDNGIKFPLRSIRRAAKYNKWRKTTPKLNRSKTTPTKHNLTLTGQLLDGIQGLAIGSKMIVRMKNNRRDGRKNTDIVDGQEKLGRKFFELSKKEITGLKNKIKRDLIKVLRRT